MGILPLSHGRAERQEKREPASSVQPISRDASVAGSRTTDTHKSLPDPPLGFAERWRGFWEPPLLNTWLAEILALTFSAACLIAIVIVLKIYDSKSIPQIPFGLTLNAIISILATGSKSSLLLAVAGAISQLKWSWFTTRRRTLEDIQEFDDASRGPWGSVSLLFTINIRSLASIGALVTVLTLAYDPFVQQVLKYPVRIINQPSNGTATTQALVWIPDPNTAEFGNALNAGVWSDEMAFSRVPACPSGNCNWPPFRSMGWCTKCEDVASRVDLGECPFEDYYDDMYTALQCNLTFDGNPSIRYAWGNRTWIGTKHAFFDDESPYRHDATLLSQVSWPIHRSVNETGPTILGVHNPALVFGYVSMYYLAQPYNTTKVRPSVEHAEQCVITPCARVYNISTVNGVLRTDVLEENYGHQKIYTVPLDEPVMAVNQTQDLFCWQPDPGNLTWHYIAPVGPTGSRAGLYNPWIPNVPKRFENISESGFCSLYDYQDRLVAALNGSGSADAGEITPGDGQQDFWEWLDKYPYSVFGFSPVYSNPAVQKIKTTDLKTVVSSVAASLTKLGLDLSNVTVHGNVSTTEVYVHAEWKWLIFPMALEALGILLLILTIVTNCLQRTRLWKSSVLPLLYHGLDDSVARSQSPPQDVFRMEEWARRTKVKLDSVGGSDRIVLVSA